MKEVPTHVLLRKYKDPKRGEYSFFHCPYVSIQQKVWLRLNMCNNMLEFGICYPRLALNSDICVTQFPEIKGMF